MEETTASDKRIHAGSQAKLNGGRFSAIGQIVKDQSALAFFDLSWRIGACAGYSDRSNFPFT